MRTVQVTSHRARELAAIAVYLGALGFVAATVTDVLPIATLSGAVYLRWSGP